MANEVQNKHHVRFRSDFHTDATTDQAIQELDANKSDGVSGDEMDNFLSSSADNNQITEREYSAMNRWVQQNYQLLSPEAREKWSMFDQAMRGAGGVGQAEKHHKTDEVVILGGPLFTGLMKDIQEIGKTAPPPAPPSDGVHGPGGAATSEAPPASAPPHSNPPAPPPEPTISGPNLAIGDSWGEILAALLAKLSDKEVALKERGKKLGGANKPQGEQTGSEQKELTEFQMELQELQRLFQMVSQISQSLHDTAKQTIGNIRA